MWLRAQHVRGVVDNYEGLPSLLRTVCSVLSKPETLPGTEEKHCVVSAMVQTLMMIHVSLPAWEGLWGVQYTKYREC